MELKTFIGTILNGDLIDGDDVKTYILLERVRKLVYAVRAGIETRIENYAVIKDIKQEHDSKLLMITSKVTDMVGIEDILKATFSYEPDPLNVEYDYPCVDYDEMEVSHATRQASLILALYVMFDSREWAELYKAISKE